MGKHKIRNVRHVLDFLGNGEYAHEIYCGTYEIKGDHKVYNANTKMYEVKAGVAVKWTQLGDGEENNGQPAADFVIRGNRICLETGDEKFDKSWEIPTYIKDLELLVKEEIDPALNDYYNQWEEQPRFIKKEK